MLKKTLFSFMIFFVPMLALANTNNDTAKQYVTFNGLNHIMVTHKNASVDKNKSDLAYCKSHNFLAKQKIVISYNIRNLQHQTATVESYQGKPVLYPMGINNEYAFMSDSTYGNVSSIVFEMNKSFQNQMTHWMGTGHTNSQTGHKFYCSYYSNSPVKTSSS